MTTISPRWATIHPGHVGLQLMVGEGTLSGLGCFEDKDRALEFISEIVGAIDGC